MKEYLVCKVNFYSPFYKDHNNPRFECGKSYEVIEKRKSLTGNEYWLFRISGTSKENSDVEALYHHKVWDYFETLEETRNKKLNSILSFGERSKLGLEQLSNQPPVTLEMAREQVSKVRERSISKDKKQR